MIGWYDQPLEPMPKETIDTELGKLTISVGEDYRVTAETVTPVKLNRIEYKVYLYAELNLGREEWHCYVNDLRRTDGSRQYTENARAKAKAVFVPAMQQWLDEHTELIEQGRRQSIVNRIQRGRYKLDDVIAKVNERRTELDRIQQQFEQTGSVSDNDLRLLNDVWSWRF